MPPRPPSWCHSPSSSLSDSASRTAPNSGHPRSNPPASPSSSSSSSSIASASTSRPTSPALRPQATSSSVHLQVPHHHHSSPAIPHQSSSSDTAIALSTASSDGDSRDNIEMAPIAEGHRRRRSSLMSPQLAAPVPSASGAPAARTGAAGAAGAAGKNPDTGAASANSTAPAQGLRAGLQVQTTNLGGDEPKIIEEDAVQDGSGRLLRYGGGGGSSRAHNSQTAHDDGDDDSGSGSGFSSDEDLRDDEETGLTRKERRRRRLKRDRNQRLDQRLVASDITAEEKKEADQNVVKRSAVNVLFIGLWYFFSLMISIYNKWMFGKGRLNFAFPLFTTCFHMLVQFALASLVLYVFPSLRPPRPSDRGRSRHQPEVEKPLMGWFFYFTRIGPCGAATGLDIGLGNMSLKFITLTFYTMCKSSALAFVLLFAFVFRLETPTWKLVSIIATMTVGVIMMVAGEVEFNLGGFVLVISAAFFSGFRWGLTQILLLRNPATSNPFSSIFFLAPVMFVTLLCIAVPVEGPVALYHGFLQLAADRGYVQAPLILLFPGCIAFLMTASEFALLQRTSVVTLSIAGICKEVVTLIAAALVFDDRLSPVNFVGLATTIGAISAYNWIKINKMREDAQDEVHRMHVAPPQPLSPSDRLRSGSPIASDDEPGSAAAFRRSGDGFNEPLITAGGDIVPTPSWAGRDQNQVHKSPID